MKIRTKLFVVISSLVALAILIIAGTSYYYLSKNIRQERIHDVGLVAKNRHQQLIGELLAYKQSNENLLTRVIYLCKLDVTNRQMDNRCIIDRINLHLKIENANGAIFRIKNKEIEWIIGKVANQRISKTEFHKSQLAVFGNRGKNNQAQPFYVMVSNEQVGIEIFIEYPLESIQKIFHPLDELGKSGETFLADSTGFFITEQRYHSHHGTQQGTKDPITANPMKKCLIEKTNTEVLDLDYREEPIIHGFRYVPEIGGGCIMAHIEQSEAFLQLEDMTKKLVTGTVLLLMIILISIYYFAKKITQPLLYLADIVESYGSGSGSGHSELQRKDEIGVISNAFNKLVKSLKENREAIELQQQAIFESSKLNAMGEMAKGVAHEINSPLAAMILAAELIERKNSKLPDPNKDISQLVKNIIEAGARVETIVMGLKGIARNAAQDAPVAFPIKHLINSSLDLCGEKLKENNIKLIINENNMETILRGNETLLAQCLFNLITNSAEAISQLAEKWIQFDVGKLDNEIKLSITDSGKGISPDVQKLMYRPMYTTKPIGSGPGLGLNVARSIITNIGGKLDYRENNGHTCFVLSLPYNQS